MFSKIVNPAMVAAMMAVILSVIPAVTPGVSAFHQPSLPLASNKARPGFSRPSTTALSGHMFRWGAATAKSEAPHPKASDQAGATLTTLFLSPQHNPPFPAPVSPEECPLHILDPHVRENEHGYKLTFNLPDAVTEDGLDISVRFVRSLAGVLIRPLRVHTADYIFNVSSIVLDTPVHSPL